MFLPNYVRPIEDFVHNYSIIEVGFFRKLVQEASVSFIFSHFPFSFLTSQTLSEDDLLENEWLNLLPL